MSPLDENRSIDKSFNYSRDIRSSRFKYTSGTRNHLNSSCVTLFDAIKANNVNVIKKYLIICQNGVNHLDKLQKNVIQFATYALILKPEACNFLIKAGINLDNRDFQGNTVLASFVSNFHIHQKFPNHFELFRCFVEGGADLNIKYYNPLDGEVNIREKISSNPELEAIVQDVNAKRANHVYAAIGGDFCVTKLVCEILDLSPASNWRPSINC